MTIHDMYSVFKNQSDQVIREHLLTLPAKQKRALILYMTGAHYKEIAFQMQIGYESAKTHVRLGLKKFVMNRGEKAYEQKA